MTEPLIWMIMVLSLAVGTWSMRLFPFIAFSRRAMPAWLMRLQTPLSVAAAGLLQIYVLKDITNNHPIAQGLALGWIVLVHLKYRNVYLSVFSGTLLFVMLRQWL